MITLYPHQQRLVDQNPSKHLLAFGTGTGKTILALALADKNSVNAVIIVPKALKENWRRNVDSLYPNLSHIVVSKEEFRRDWNDIPKYNAIIIDEMHFFGNLKSQMSKSLQKYIKKHDPKYIWGLSATPFCSSPMNVFALAKHLGHDWNYWTFFNRFFQRVQMGARAVPVLRTGIENDVAELIHEIGTTCKLEDCVEVPEQIFETVYFELTKKQTKAIKDIVEPQHIVRWTRTHTIENGVRIGDEYEDDEYYDSLKNDYIVSFSEENTKFAVICRYNLQIELLKSTLESKGKTVYIINGSVKNRDEVVQQIENTPECIAIIQASCAVGFEIPSVPIMIFASLSFSFVDHQQSIGRILRINKLKKNVYQYLVIKDGVDEAVYECIMRKQSFDIAIYSK